MIELGRPSTKPTTSAMAAINIMIGNSHRKCGERDIYYVMRKRKSGKSYNQSYENKREINKITRKFEGNCLWG